jgi:tetratricopeptide (TPR) repeat protein
MPPDPTSPSIDFDHVHAGRDIRIGDTTNHYYGAAERPPALHVGVPPMPAHFVGREPLVAEVAQRLVAGLTLALSADGLPGVGKTTLAVALAYRREVLDHFTDGVLWGGLGLQPNVMEVLASWASALGFDASAATDPRTRAERVRNAIGQRRFLLVIDDAWAPADNALLLRCGGPNCAHFLTTRDESIARAFADPRGAIGIDVLAPEDALQLLTTLAPEACAADPDAARQLVAAVGYLPLAIELMGAYLSAAENRYFREMQTAALRTMADPADRLRQACTRLGDTDGATVTLQDTIRLSLQGLPDEAVAAFHALGAFAPKPDTFDLEAAKAVTGASLATLSRLLERHLLEQDEGEKLSLHQTIADVARSQTPDDAVQAHVRYYLERVIQAGADWRGVEQVYGQVKWSFAHVANAMRTLELAAALSDYQLVRGLRQDGLQWKERELDAARTVGDRRREAITLGNRGLLLDQLGESDQALEQYEQALAIQREIGDRKSEATTLNNLGNVYDRRGQPDRAVPLHQEALSIRREVGDRKGEAVTLHNLGSVYDSLGQWDEALEFYNQALPIRRETGDRIGEATTLNNIGVIHSRREEHDRSMELWREALALRQAIGDLPGEAVTLNNIGYSYSGQGDLEGARACFQRALPILQAVGDRHTEAITRSNLGLILESLGEVDRAMELYREALSIHQAVNNRGGEALTRFKLAVMYREAGRLEETVAELRQVVELETAVQHPDLEHDRRFLAEVEAELARLQGNEPAEA